MNTPDNSFGKKGHFKEGKMYTVYRDLKQIGDEVAGPLGSARDVHSNPIQVCTRLQAKPLTGNRLIPVGPTKGPGLPDWVMAPYATELLRQHATAPTRAHHHSAKEPVST